MNLIAYEDLKTFVRGTLDAVGLDDFSARSVTEGLCETSLRGVDSHGVRLLPHYAESALSGRKNPHPAFTFTRSFRPWVCLMPTTPSVMRRVCGP